MNDQDAAVARSILLGRKFRGEEFGQSLFSDVVWDMLLTLFIADAEGSRLTGRELISKCPVSMDVGRRWTAHLNAVGLVVGDGEGHLDDCLTMSPLGLAKMERYMERARECHGVA